MSFTKYTNSGVSVSVVLDKREARKTKDGQYRVRIKVYSYYQTEYYKTGALLTTEQWNELAATRKPPLVREREKIRLMFEKCIHYVEKALQRGRFSFDTFSKMMGVGNSIEKSINVAFQNKIKQLSNEHRVGTASAYAAALNSFEKFAGNSISFSKITIDWLKKYEQKQLENGLSATTVGIYLRSLRSVINDAIRNDDFPQNAYPFGQGKYEIPSTTGRKLALKLADVQRVVNFDCENNETLQRYLDLWTFSYLCNGANFNDILRLRHENIVAQEIYFFRGKTASTTKDLKEIAVFLHPKLKKIIKKWGTPTSKPKDYIFPYLTGGETPLEEKAIIADVIKRTNKRMKHISEQLKLPKITTYTARHSFATVLKRSGANIAFISESLGHSDLKTTENYLASFETEERKKNAMLLLADTKPKQKSKKKRLC